MKNSTLLTRTEKFLRYLFPVAVSAGMVIWLFRKVNGHEMLRVIHQGIDWQWIVLSMFILMVSRMIRGIRWGIQLRAAGVPRMTVMAESTAIWGAYALNLLFPWLGEAWRCIHVARRYRTPLATVVGTDIGDRLSDAAMIVVLVVVSLFAARPEILRFMDHYKLGYEVAHLFDDPMLWSSLAVVVASLWAVLHFGIRFSAVRHFRQTLGKVWQGFRVLFTMRGRGMYLLLTAAIWICYFLETYVCLMAFPFTRELITSPGTWGGLIPGLVLFVFGSLSMGVPSNGGLGPWNVAVMFALSLYGIDSVDGAAFSMTVWTAQTLMQVLLGIVSAAYLNNERLTMND